MKMQKYLLFLLMIMTMSMWIFGCAKEDEKVGNAHMNVVDGKVIKIMDKNQIMLETTKERGGYKKGENLIVKFQNIVSVGEEVDFNQYEIQQDDIVVVQFDAAKKLDEYDYVETDTIGIYMDEQQTIE